MATQANSSISTQVTLHHEPLESLGALSRRFQETRAWTEALCEGLLAEDLVIQSMPDASPAKWHLAHTTWFFETFLLKPNDPAGYRPFDPGYHFLFNSYYKSQGAHFERARRGLLSRPGVEEVFRYRRQIDQRVLSLLNQAPTETFLKLSALVELGIQHEQQHQELLLTDIKNVFWANPLRPAYRSVALTAKTPALRSARESQASRVMGMPEGIIQIGWDSTVKHPSQNFAFDHEMPRHRVFLEAYGIHSRPASCGDYLEFIDAGGYQDPRYWLSAGWDKAQAENWNSPLYWEQDKNGSWLVFTLQGMKSVDENEPVCHISFYEADAFARWRGLRLPTEAEWENAAAGWKESASSAEGADRRMPEVSLIQSGNFAEAERFHPEAGGPIFFGNVWEWTASPYLAYPGFKPLASSLGEYNGKFMCNQFVLRGGSCATPRSHIRTTYRNFFPPEARWQFSGLRLAL